MSIGRASAWRSRVPNNQTFLIFIGDTTMAHAAFQWQDPFLLDQQLTDDERMVRDAATAYCQDKLQPRVTQAFREGSTDVAIFREMGELGLLGPTIPEVYGGPGLNYVAYSLIAR